MPQAPLERQEFDFTDLDRCLRKADQAIRRTKAVLRSARPQLRHVVVGHGHLFDLANSAKLKNPIEEIAGELIEDSCYNDKRLGPTVLVAGNVWNAGVVLGAPVADWRALDLAEMTALLSINGREIGNGRAAM
jgi:hypothetical protein